MSEDIVARLREYGMNAPTGFRVYHDAASEIERLRAEHDALRALLRGATAVLEPVSFNMYDHDIREAARIMVARIDTALNKGGGGE